MSQNINKSNIKSLHSELIPDCCDTASYDDFYQSYIDDVIRDLPKNARELFDALLGSLALTAGPARTAAVAAFEAAHPALFRRLYVDLITYFYSTPEAAERVRALADAAPREPSPHFDPALLTAVIENQRGKRRL
jgi:hypothetical protein